MSKMLNTPSKYFLVLSFFIFIISCSEDKAIEEVDVCQTNRYAQETFSAVTATNDVEYGRAIGVNNTEEILLMDVFQPKEDAISKRPLIVWVHGGSFIGGTKGDMALLCEEASKRGFVTATISYRLLNIFNGLPDSTALADIVIKSTRDLKNAVNYFIDDAKGPNKFRIDPNQIYVGGASAGAIIALHATYLDDNDNLPPFIKKAIADNAGLEPRTTAVKPMIKAVLNLSGAVIYPNIIQKNEAPVYSIHGDADDVVPYSKGFIGGQDFPILEMYGSKAIDDYAKSIGLPSYFVGVPGGGHVDIYFDEKFASLRNTFLDNTYLGLKEIICK